MCCLPLAAGVGRLARRCPAGVCMAGIGGLLKLSQLVVAGSLASVGKLASTGSGVGGGAVLGDMFFRE